jgi:hypothetical protein
MPTAGTDDEKPEPEKRDAERPVKDVGSVEARAGQVPVVVILPASALNQGSI